jgi:hypothetical protein
VSVSVASTVLNKDRVGVSSGKNVTALTDDSGIQCDKSLSHTSEQKAEQARQERHYLNVAPKLPKDAKLKGAKQLKGAQKSVTKNERHYLNVAPKVPNSIKAQAPIRISPRLNKGKAAKKFGFED